MTQKAPERIWLMDDELSDFEDTYPVDGSTGFIQIDHALALVAAAYEDAARHHDYYAYNYKRSPEDRAAHQEHARRIRDRTDADAQDALSKLLQEARNEALREALDIARLSLTGDADGRDIFDAIDNLITENQSDDG